MFAKLEREEGPDTWLMPSVLRQVTEEKVKEVYVSASPLAVDFPDGGPQNGIFCSLMAHVLSPQHPHPHPWKLCLSFYQPKCLYRDCIQLHGPDFGSVTLVDHFQHFEAHISDTTAKKKSRNCGNMCTNLSSVELRRYRRCWATPTTSHSQPSSIQRATQTKTTQPVYIENGEMELHH